MTDRAVYMTLVNPSSGSAFVKELDFFKSQGGLKEPWGQQWKPVVAISIESARYIAVAECPEARPFTHQAFAELSAEDRAWLETRGHRDVRDWRDESGAV